MLFRSTQNTYDDFRGVYWGQSALHIPAEQLIYLTNDTLDACTVLHYETGKETGIYDLEELTSNDPYEVYLSGADALSVITNPGAATDRELLIFRDSFGSSITPWLVEGYSTITLIDLRYISSELLPQFIDFHGQDVLFLYSPSVFNNAAMLK